MGHSGGETTGGGGMIDNSSSHVGKGEAEEACCQQSEDGGCEAPAIRGEAAKDPKGFREGFPIELCLGQIDACLVVA